MQGLGSKIKAAAVNDVWQVVNSWAAEVINCRTVSVMSISSHQVRQLESQSNQVFDFDWSYKSTISQNVAVPLHVACSLW